MDMGNRGGKGQGRFGGFVCFGCPVQGTMVWYLGACGVVWEFGLSICSNKCGGIEGHRGGKCNMAEQQERVCTYYAGFCERVGSPFQGLSAQLFCGILIDPSILNTPRWETSRRR